MQVHREPQLASRRLPLLPQQGASCRLTTSRAAVRVLRCGQRAHLRERFDHRQGFYRLVVGTKNAHRNGYSDAFALRGAGYIGDGNSRQHPRKIRSRSSRGRSEIAGYKSQSLHSEPRRENFARRRPRWQAFYHHERRLPGLRILSEDTEEWLGSDAEEGRHRNR